MKKFFLLSIVLISGFFAVVFYANEKQYSAYREEEVRLLLELEKETERSAKLEKDKNFQGTDAYVEKIAREKLGLVHPDEIIIYNASEQDIYDR